MNNEMGNMTIAVEKRFLRLPDVLKLVGLKKSTLYLYISQNKFPAQKKIGGRISVWAAADVYRWMEDLSSVSY